MLGRNRVYHIIVGGRAKKVDRDHSAGTKPTGYVFNLPLQIAGIDVEAASIDIHEDRYGARGQHDLGRCGESKGWQEDRIAGANARRHEGDQERVRAARTADRVRHTRARGQGGLELRNLRPHDVAAMIEYCRHARFEFGLQSGLLRLQVDERDRLIQVWRCPQLRCHGIKLLQR